MPLAGQFNGIRIKYLCGKIIHKNQSEKEYFREN